MEDVATVTAIVADQHAEIARLRAEVEWWERIAQEGHPTPCTLGPLCPYCEIERLRAEVEEKDRLIEQLKEIVKVHQDRIEELEHGDG